MGNASHRSHHPHRGPPAHRLRGRRRQGQEGLVLGPDVARRRADPARPRPARRLGHHAAHLRRVHHGARHRLGARGRERAADGGAAQRPVHPQPDHPGARGARPHRALLPPVGARLGGRDLGAEGRPGRHREAGREPVAWPATAFEMRAVKERLGLRRRRPARHLHQRLLGPPGDEAAARGEPAGGGALPAGARRPAQGQQDRLHPRQQDAAHPERGRRRRVQRRSPPTASRRWASSACWRSRAGSTSWPTSSRRSTSSTSPRSAPSTPTGPSIGAGVTNYLAVPDIPLDTKGTEVRAARRLHRRTATSLLQADQDLRTTRFWVKGVAESSSTPGTRARALHPYQGETKPQYTDFKDDGKYSWLKSPTFYGKPAQVGPLARVLCMLAAGHDRPRSTPPRRSTPCRRWPRPRSGSTPCTRPSAATRRARSCARCRSTCWPTSTTC
jgi:hypothetical protein